MFWMVFKWVDRGVFWASCALVLVSLFDRSATGNSASELPEETIEFRPGRTQYAWWVTMTSWIPLIVIDFFHRHHETPWSYVTLAVCAFLIIASALGVPGTIRTNPEGISQHFWLRPNKRIGWLEIAQISTIKRGAIEIVSNNHSKITFGFLAGRDRFLMEIKKHCGSELPEDFPREPVEALERSASEESVPHRD